MSATLRIQAGFGRAFHEPAIVLAEIAWRWSFGLATLALAAGIFLAYLDTIPITKTELLVLRSGVPWLMIDAITHILSGSGPRLARCVAMMLPAMAILWIAAASLGRAATLKALLGHEERVALATQIGLNSVRASVTLASLIGYLGAAIIAGRTASGDANVHPGIFLLVFVVLGTAITIVRSRVNWFISLAAILAARGGHDTFTAIGGAFALFRRHVGKFAGAGAVFGTIHGVLLAFCSVVCLLALSVASIVPRVATLFLLTVTTLAYLAVVDFLHIARLATYVAIDEGDRTPPVAVAPEPPPMPTTPPLAEPGLPSPEGAAG